MPWRVYPNKEYRILKDGTRKMYVYVQRQWVKSGQRRHIKKGFARQSIYSTRFGFLDLYNRNEQAGLICPSGYNIRQCFNTLRKLWWGYHTASRGEKLEQIEKYAKAIQDVQKDMGIKTTSFPHLGMYGDVFILHNKNDERVVFEDHSAMKKQQEEYEKEQAENAKKIQEKLQKPDKEKGEDIESFADDVSPYEMEDNEETVPDLLEEEKDEEEEVITMTDDIPFTLRGSGSDQ